MKTSKVVAAKFDHSYPSKYGDDNGQLHQYNIKFENGDEGEYSSKSTDQNKFVVGKVACYEITDKPNGKGKKVAPAKCPDDQPGQPSNQGNQSYQKKQMDPEEQDRIIRQVCYECAISALESLDATDIEKDMDFVLSEKLFVWYKSKATSTGNSMTAGKALREAVRATAYPPLRTGTGGISAVIISKAEEIYEYFGKKAEEAPKKEL